MRKIFAVAAVTTSSLFSLIVGAQPDSSFHSLDEAQVTATKYLTKTSLTGKVVTIIDSAEINRHPARDLSQLLSMYSGLTITGANGSPGKDKTIFLRGAAAEFTLVMVDGIPVSDPSGIGGHFDIRNLSLSNVERIEIVKGSQSTLYGSAAIAGVINIITKKSTGEKIQGEATVSGGSYETFKAATGLRGRQGDWNYFANYSFTGSRGINDAALHPMSGETDRDGFRQHVIDLGAGLQVGPNLKLQPFARYAFHRGDIDDGSFADELDFTYDQRSLMAGLSALATIGKGRFHFNYQFSHIDRLYIDDSTASRNGFDIYNEGGYEGAEHFLDAYLHLPAGDRWRLTAGADFRHSRSDQYYESLGPFPYSARYSGDSLRQQQYAIYAAVNLSQPGGFNFEAGGRLNVHSEYGTQPVFNINPSFLINRKWKLFANLSTGYRTPTVYQLYSEFGNRFLEPETSLSLEGGVQYYNSANRAGARLVYFRRNVDDVLFFFTDPATFRSAYVNQDRQRDHGVELEGTVHLSERFSLRAFYQYLDGRLHSRVNGKDTSYNNLIRRPKHSAGLSFTGRIGSRFTGTLHLNYTGERSDLYFDPFTYATVHTVLDAYLLCDLYADYRFGKGKVHAFADLRNLGNALYTEISGFNTMGRNGYVGVRFNWR